MNRIFAGLAVAALGAACDQAGPPPGSIAKGLLQELSASNATVIGYLYKPAEPSIIASFDGGSLLVRTDPTSRSAIQGPAEVVLRPDRSCIGIKQKSLLMPNHGPESYLVCEAQQSIEHSNSLPRSQDFRLDRGALFMMYEPPKGTGDVQLFYAIRAK
jgi:hypothetical protein